MEMVELKEVSSSYSMNQQLEAKVTLSEKT